MSKLSDVFWYAITALHIYIAGTMIHSGDYITAMWVGITTMWMINYLSADIAYDNLLNKTLTLLKKVNEVLEKK